MIIVDTSVWITAHRKPQGPDAQTLRELLDAGEVALALPVRIEFLSRAAKTDRAKLRRALKALPLVVPTDETWQLIESWAARARDVGQKFSIPDLLIAAAASELVGLVWSLDKDFEEMEKLGFVKRY